MRWSPLLLLALLLFVPSVAAGAQEEAAGEEPWATFGETLSVSLSRFPVRVVDTRGEPVRGLTKENFVVFSGDHRIPVVAVDWVESGGGLEGEPGEPPAPPGTEPPPFELPEAETRADAGAAAREPLPPPPLPSASPEPPAPLATAGSASPRLVVVFVQADFNAPRIYGHLKMLPRVKQILDSLPARDLVAVVSFDSHLKLWHDFTTDREAAHEAIWRAVHFGAREPTGTRRRRGGGPSLAATFDRRAAQDAAWAEEGLEIVARALAPLCGSESSGCGDRLMIFLGWGLGRYGFGGFRMRGHYMPAIEALQRADVTVFAFDVMDAASHTLELGLKQVAADTGGAYYRTATNPILATERLIRTLAGGHYVVTVDADELPAPGSEVRVQLEGAPRGSRLHVRPMEVVE